MRRVERIAAGGTALRRQLASHEDAVLLGEAGHGRSLPRIDLNRPIAQRPRVEAATARVCEAANRRFQGRKRPDRIVWRGSTVMETEVFIREDDMPDWLRDLTDRRLGGLSIGDYQQDGDSISEEFLFGWLRIGSRMVFTWGIHPFPVSDGLSVPVTSFNLVVGPAEAVSRRDRYGLKAPTADLSDDPVVVEIVPGGWVDPHRVLAVEGVRGDLDASRNRAFRALQDALREKGPRAMIDERIARNTLLHRLSVERASEAFLMAGQLPNELTEGTDRLFLLDQDAELPVLGDFALARAMLRTCSKRVPEGLTGVCWWYQRPSDHDLMFVAKGWERPDPIVIVELFGRRVAFGGRRARILLSAGRGAALTTGSGRRGERAPLVCP
jgi:hypothetical protein